MLTAQPDLKGHWTWIWMKSLWTWCRFHDCTTWCPARHRFMPSLMWICHPAGLWLLMPYYAFQYSAIQYNTVPYYTRNELDDTLQQYLLQCNRMQCNAVQCRMRQSTACQCSSIERKPLSAISFRFGVADCASVCIWNFGFSLLFIEIRIWKILWAAFGIRNTKNW